MTSEEQVERQQMPVLPGPHPVECNCERCKQPDIVQVQREAWARITEEERLGLRQREIVRWSR